MANYLMLGRFTEKGMNSIQESSERIKKFRDLCETEGAKVVSYHMLMGRYDVACVLEAPNANVIAKIALVLGKRGNVRTETMCAFTDKEQIDLVSKLKS